MLKALVYEGEQMTQQGPDSRRQTRQRRGIAMAAFGVGAIVGGTTHAIDVLVLEVALVSVFLRFTRGRIPGSDRVTVPLLFCLFGMLFVIAAALFFGRYMLTTGPIGPVTLVPTPVTPPRR